MKTTVTKGAVVRCQANGNMEHEFIGTVVKRYENSAWVTIDEFDPRDQMNARDLLFQSVIALKRMTILKAGEPEPEPEVEEAAG